MKLLTVSLLTFIATHLQVVSPVRHDAVLDLAEKEKALVFSTWEGFEVDKCASIWLIKRFVHKDAVIKFYPRGATVKEGIPFDTPDAKFRRYHNMSTYETLLHHYELKNPKLIYIGKIVHDIEVNVWEEKVLKETPMVEDAVNRIISGSTDNREIIEKSIKFFDSLFEKILG